MTYEASRAGSTTTAGWVLPALVSGILTLLWGAYTLLVVAHIFAIPLPAYPS